MLTTEQYDRVVAKFASLRATGQSVQEFIGQPGLFGSGMPSEDFSTEQIDLLKRLDAKPIRRRVETVPVPTLF